MSGLHMLLGTSKQHAKGKGLVPYQAKLEDNSHFIERDTTEVIQINPNSLKNNCLFDCDQQVSKSNIAPAILSINMSADLNPSSFSLCYVALP